MTGQRAITLYLNGGNNNWRIDEGTEMNNDSPPPRKKNVRVQYLLFAIAGLLLLFVGKFPFPQSVLEAGDVVLQPQGRMALGILFFCLFLWVTEPVPFHITGCIGVLLMTFLKLDSFGNIIRLGFGNDTVVFLIGVLVLSSVMTRSGLGKRVSMFILSLTGNKATTIILGFIIAGVFVGMFISNMAVAAMLMPLAKAMLEEERLKPKESNFGKALMISCSYGATISGITTPAAAAPNIIAMNYIKGLGVDITFLEWMVYGVPTAFLLVIPCWLILIKVFKPEISHLSKTTEELATEFKKLGPMNRNEIATTIIFFITITLWISSTWLNDLTGIDLAGSVPALVCTCLFFMPGITTLKWKQVSEDISWEAIILIATGMSMGLIMHQAGAALWLANVLVGGITGIHPLVQIFMIVMIIELIKVGLSSNTVTAAIIMPIMVALAQSQNLPLKGILIPAALSLSLAFILVASSPTNLIPYSAGYFSIADMAKAGAIITVFSAIIIALSIFSIGSFMGIY